MSFLPTFWTITEKAVLCEGKGGQGELGEKCIEVPSSINWSTPESCRILFHSLASLHTAL